MNVPISFAFPILPSGWLACQLEHFILSALLIIIEGQRHKGRDRSTLNYPLQPRMESSYPSPHKNTWVLSKPRNIPPIAVDCPSPLYIPYTLWTYVFLT